MPTNAAGESERYDYDDQHVILQRQLAGEANPVAADARAGKDGKSLALLKLREKFA